MHLFPPDSDCGLEVGWQRGDLLLLSQLFWLLISKNIHWFPPPPRLWIISFCSCLRSNISVFFFPQWNISGPWTYRIIFTSCHWYDLNPCIPSLSHPCFLFHLSGWCCSLTFCRLCFWVMSHEAGLVASKLTLGLTLAGFVVSLQWLTFHSVCITMVT